MLVETLFLSEFYLFFDKIGDEKRVFFLLFFVSFRALFPTLETLKIVLPPARELNFYKIALFALSPKIHQKTIEIRPPKSKKNRKKMRKKGVWKHAGF